MAREKWQIILSKAYQQDNFFTKSDVNKWFEPLYYANAEHYASQMLQRMVKDGCIKRIKKGIYQVMRSPKRMGGGVASSRVLVDANQVSLF